MEILLSTKQVAALAGASVRQVGYWADTGLVRPSGKSASGKGTRRLFTFIDLVAIKTIAGLRERRCPLQKVRKAIRYLKAHYSDVQDQRWLSRLTLLTDGQQVYMLTDAKQVMEVLSRQTVWSVPLGMFIRQSQEQVEKLPLEWTKSVRVTGRTFSLRITRDIENGGYVVQCRQLPGALEQGDTIEEAVNNGKQAIRSVLSFRNKQRLGGATGHVRTG